MMPGGNSCVFPQCTVLQSKKYEGISLFKLPQKKCDLIWKSEIVTILKKYRVLDQSLKNRIDNGKVFVCERHYEESDIEYTSKLVLFSSYRLSTSFR